MRKFIRSIIFGIIAGFITHKAYDAIESKAIMVNHQAMAPKRDLLIQAMTTEIRKAKEEGREPNQANLLNELGGLAIRHGVW